MKAAFELVNISGGASSKNEPLALIRMTFYEGNSQNSTGLKGCPPKPGHTDGIKIKLGPGPALQPN